MRDILFHQRIFYFLFFFIWKKLHDTPRNHFEDLMIHTSRFIPSIHFENVWAIKELYSRMDLKVHLRKLWEDRFRPKINYVVNLSLYFN